MTLLSSAGYRVARTSASGQRRGSRRDERGLAGDAIALSTVVGTPHLLVEVGGAGKRLGAAFSELRKSITPGFAPLVVRFVDRKCWIYVDEDHRFRRLDDALDSLRAA